MKHTFVLVLGLAIAALIGWFGGIRPGDCRAQTYAAEQGHAKARHYRHRPLEVTVYGRRRIGGYSYSASSVVNTYNRQNPPPYANVRQTPGGPFDTGFFFDSAIGPQGGQSPSQLHP
jgi:hypothetical protein